MGINEEAFCSDQFLTAPSGGLKHSEAKLPFHLITPEMESALAEGLNLGINKGYPTRNWEKGLPLDECHVAAARRHINKWRSGEDFNKEAHMETGEAVPNVHHLICAYVNLGMAVTQIMRQREDLDDRVKP